MALTKIQIDNFVVFKHIEVIPSQGVNVIIGKNGFVAYHALYQDEDDMVCCEKADRFDELKHNAIMDAYNKLLDEVYGLQVGE